LRPKTLSGRRLEKMYNEEVHDKNSSPNIIRMMKSRKVRRI
jgi:hypothetical protein